VFQVRAAKLADIPALLVLEQRAPAAAHWSEAEYHRLFGEGAGCITLVIEDDSIQGFMVGRDLGPEWEIENIVVASHLQRCGLGTRLLTEFLELANRRGVKQIILEVRESNRAARALYNKLGFSETGRRKSYYRNPDEDALLYRKL
jgi:[ribosomal protein S18]-alanine N-acetyltransferase